MSEPEIEEAIVRVKAGNLDDYRTVVAAYHERLRAVLAGLCPPGVDPDEIAQLNFLEAHRNLGRYRPGSDFFAWLSRIARYRLLAESKRLQRQWRHRRDYIQFVLSEGLSSLAQAETEWADLRFGWLHEYAFAVLNQGDGTDPSNGMVSVLLGNGDGTFRGAADYAAGTNPGFGYPGSLTVGDLNNDGSLDLAVANAVHGFAVLYGKGDGSFASPIESHLVDLAQSIAVGDFTGNGKTELLVGGDGVSVMEFLGNNSFRTAFTDTEWDLGTAVGDFNRDGKLDFVALDGPTVTVFLGNGDDSFRTLSQPGAGPGAFYHYSTAVADLNGDGIPDLIFPAGRGAISLLLRNGDGTFRPISVESIEPEPNEYIRVVAVGDFNGDGKPDLALADGSSGISVLLNAGVSPSKPTFAATDGFLTFSAHFLVGDSNGDGRPDLASIETTQIPGSAISTGSDILVHLGNGDGTLQPAFLAGGAPTVPRSIATGDFNGNGKLDIVVASSDSGKMSVLLGNGDGSFKASVESDIPPGASVLAVGDVNGDGKSDVVLLEYGDYDPTRGAYTSVLVLLSKGDGTAQAEQNGEEEFLHAHGCC